MSFIAPFSVTPTSWAVSCLFIPEVILAAPMQSSVGHQAAGIATSVISVASFTVEVTQPPFPTLGRSGWWHCEGG